MTVIIWKSGRPTKRSGSVRIPIRDSLSSSTSDSAPLDGLLIRFRTASGFSTTVPTIHSTYFV
jgi:hypothetical protein